MQSANQPSPASQPQLRTPPQPREAEAPADLNQPALPDRNVTADSIEDAYVSFILFCNPALAALHVDTTTLRDAFRNPPRSGGKSFNTFVVWELVRKFYDKEIPTWTELIKEMGVEPPDPAKDESAQKIAQYGVRLKKWMNSMHIRSFFEYLMDVANDYWTNIPTDPNPIGQPVRDGVAVEDDMALRALVPHIRPKRGRKRWPDEETTAYFAQRTRLSPSSAVDDPRRGPPGLQVPTDTFAAPWTPSDVQQMPLTRWPQSAITPTCRGSFWDDALEPRSAVVGSKPRLSSQRRGAKNVSSAWRPGGPNSGVKRGRPPMNRTPIDTSFPPFPNTPIVGPGEAGEAGTPVLPTPSKSKPVTPVQRIPSPASSSNSQPQSTPQEGSRPQRPSISLQVPERPTGSVRLATPPPPVVLVNGNSSPASTQVPPRLGQINGRMDFLEASRQAATSGQPQLKQVPGFFFERVEDRTNIEDVVGQLTQATLNADWRDANGQPGRPPSLEEASALINATVEKLYKTAASPVSFLINLAALSGGSLLRTSRTCITRLRMDAETATYRSEWEYGFGSLRGLYSMEQQVPLAMFWDPTGGGGENESSETGRDEREEGEKLSADEWQAKYRRLLDNVRRKDRELLGMQHQVMKSLRGPLSKE